VTKVKKTITVYGVNGSFDYDVCVWKDPMCEVE
jgi:hypothetical protein